MLFKNENTLGSMLALGQTSILIYAIRRRRTYRQTRRSQVCGTSQTLRRMSV